MRIMFRFYILISFIIIVFVSGSAIVVAAETLDVTFNTSSAGGYWGTGGLTFNCVAVWLEDNNGNFVKTIGRWAGIRWHCLRDWVLVSGYDTDAVTGATQANFWTLTLNADIESLPDGIYKIQLELTDYEPVNAGDNNRATYTFNKNGTSSNQNPSNQGGFSNVSIVYSGRSGTGNYYPGVYAGPEQTVTLLELLSLDATVTDDGLPDDTLSTTWSKVSGPGTVIFKDALAVDTTASFSEPGSYVLRLTADDGTLQTSDDVTIKVNGVTLTCLEDVQVQKDNPSFNYEGDFRIRMYNYNSTQQAEGFVKFDLSSITGQIISAVLRISMNDFNVSTSRDISGVTSDLWSASSLTWNTKPASGSSIGSFNTGYGWIEDDITSFAQSEYISDGKVSLRFRNSSTNTSFVRFNSWEFFYVAPQLAIIYDTPSLNGVLQFDSFTYNVNEDGASATIIVSRTRGSSGLVSVDFATSNGSATAGEDFTQTSGTLNWTDGDTSTKTFTVSIIDDVERGEGDETVNLTLTNPTGGALSGSIKNAVLTIKDIEVNSLPNAPYDLKCNGQPNPAGITDLTPDLSWTFSDPDTGDSQSAYKIIVANNQSAIDNDNGNMWDTNKVDSTVNSVNYGGSALQPGATYYWKVMAWDNYDSSGPYSQVATFSMSDQAIPNPPSISVNKTTLDFGNIEIGQSDTLDFQITNTGGGTLSGTISSNKKWIAVAPATFQSNSVTVNVTADNNILYEKSGQHTGTVSITSNGGNRDIAVQLAATCVLVKPNPYDPTKGNLTFFGDGIVPQETTIKIYTLSGELVKTIGPGDGDVERSAILSEAKSCVFEGLNEVKSRNSGTIVWRGTNEEGREVINGIYIYTYESPKERGVGKITVLKR